MGLGVHVQRSARTLVKVLFFLTAYILTDRVSTTNIFPQYKDPKEVKFTRVNLEWAVVVRVYLDQVHSKREILCSLGFKTSVYYYNYD